MFFNERVKRGALWLDQILPNWFNLIDKDKLHIGQQTDCMIGQVFGNYNYWLQSGSYVCSYAHGFDCLHRKQKNFDKLKSLWLAEIDCRQCGSMKLAA